MIARSTVRQRLTVLYVVAILASGGVLLALNYALVSRQLGPTIERASAAAIEVRSPASPRPGAVAEPAEVVVLPEDQAQRIARRVRASALRELVAQSAIALAVVAVASVALGWAVAGRALRPLQRITASARRLSEETLHERLAMQGPQDEIKELADTFDAMLARLEAAFESQRRFVANASHELRTPLTVARTATEVLAAKSSPRPEQVQAMIDKVQGALQRSAQLITALLLLARSQRGLQTREHVDLAVLAHGVVEQGAPEAVARGVTIEASLAAAFVEGDPTLLERLVANLVENAIRHNRPGGWVTVATTSARGQARVEVRNSGPVVAPEQVASLLEPFRRGAQDRTEAAGLGLGLAIVSAIVHAHHGTVRVEPLEAGGLEVRVAFSPRGADANPGGASTAARAGGLGPRSRRSPRRG